MNPTLDEAISLPAIALGDKNRCTLEAIDPGGKGVNVSRVVHRLGRRTEALGFIAGVTGTYLRRQLESEGIAHAFDDVHGLTRINVMLYERSSGRRTRLYLPGVQADALALKKLKERLLLCREGDVIVLAASDAANKTTSTGFRVAIMDASNRPPRP